MCVCVHVRVCVYVRVLTVVVGKPFSLRVYGQNLTSTTEIGWSVVAGDCEDTTNSVYVCVRIMCVCCQDTASLEREMFGLH